MNPPTIDIRDVLESEGIGVFGAEKGWAIFIGREPDQPTNVITLFDTGGGSPQIPMDSTVTKDGSSDKHRKGFVEFANVQIRVRSKEYISVYAKVEQIRKALANRGVFFSLDNSAKYLNIEMQSDPLYVGEDDKRRQIFSLNIVATREPTVTAP
jgi:hypothetical protein